MNNIEIVMLMRSESTKNLESRRMEIFDNLIKKGVDPDELLDLVCIITETTLRMYKDYDSE